MSMIWSFNGIENKHDVYRGEDCIKSFCKSLREHNMKIINFEKKKNINKWTSGMKEQKSTVFAKNIRR